MTNTNHLPPNTEAYCPNINIFTFYAGVKVFFTTLDGFNSWSSNQLEADTFTSYAEANWVITDLRKVETIPIYKVELP
jgi:hypothetical protein